MMKKRQESKALLLKGEGYLHQSSKGEFLYSARNNQSLVRICCNQSMTGTTRYESLWLDCLIDHHVKTKLVDYMLNFSEHDENDLIKIHFVVRYLGTTEFQCCLTEEDPDHIVTIKAQLLDVCGVG